jgi:UDP-N-acetylglucosamine 2-epimerase (non-hydrolysing)
MTKNKIAIIGGARPNLIKIAPLVREFNRQKISHFIVNTGQHFDKNMAGNFFKEFDLKPDYHLQPDKKTVVSQFADIMKKLEEIFQKEKPFLIIVVGDVNSTLAASLVANKMNIKLAHVEAGLRSFNYKMPEETNRVLTDRISDLLFVTDPEGLINLKKEGITKNIFFVGNIMIDTLKMFLPKVIKTDENFYYCTLHRAENVDDKKIFSEILSAMEVISKKAKIYLPLHPRTKIMAEKYGLAKKMKKIFHLLPPLGYVDSLYYLANAKLVLTDSGGLQEETSYLGVPCLTLRTETERPITVKSGTNTIAGVSTKSIIKAYNSKILKNKKSKIKFWNGKTARRIVNILKNKI